MDAVMDSLGKSFGLRINEQLKTLLESKHLYQSVQVEYKDLPDTIVISPPVKRLREELNHDFFQLVCGEWFNSDPAGSRVSNTFAKLPPAIWFDMPDVKLFCQLCNGKEAFNVKSVQSILERGRLTTEPYKVSNQVVQIFVASFLCQSCKAVPEVFLIRRQGMKLTLSGRSPIEHVEVPPALPKSVQKYYSDAIVAYQSGQTLAGLFMLRTLIEQWVRQYLKESDIKADEAIDKYMEKLPPDFKTRFKSIRSLYSDISLDLHTAEGSADLFDSARLAIVKHFEARKLFDLPDSDKK